MRAILIFNLQNDFSAFGNMPLAGAEELAVGANKLLPNFDLSVAVQIAYPASHKSFAANHLFRQPGKTMMIAGKEQLLAPIHCVEGSFAAEFMNVFSWKSVNKIIKTGISPEYNIQSAFCDEEEQNNSGLVDFLKENSVEEIYLMGINAGNMILNTASEALALGFKVKLVKDACLGIEDTVVQSFEKLIGEGLQLIESNAIGNLG